jgi:hypothetical protein
MSYLALNDTQLNSQAAAKPDLQRKPHVSVVAVFLLPRTIRTRGALGACRHRSTLPPIWCSPFCSNHFPKFPLRVRIDARVRKQYVCLPEFVAMKHPITIRLDPELLASARIRAKEENRTLTNFLETALKERFEASGGSRKSKQPFDGRKIARSASSKKVSNAK